MNTRTMYLLVLIVMVGLLQSSVQAAEAQLEPVKVSSPNYATWCALGVIGGAVCAIAYYAYKHVCTDNAPAKAEWAEALPDDDDEIDTGYDADDEADDDVKRTRMCSDIITYHHIDRMLGW